MMKYLCLVYAEEKKLAAIADREPEITAKSIDYNEELMRSGKYVVSAALQSVRQATTVRTRGADILVTDGPFAETKEQLCGFILLDAQDRDDAVRLASKIPMAQLGCIEIRPVMRLEPVKEGTARQ
jgi:hypothetical protein